MGPHLGNGGQRGSGLVQVLSRSRVARQKRRFFMRPVQTAKANRKTGFFIKKLFKTLAMFKNRW
jgi:hypothetical protein